MTRHNKPTRLQGALFLIYEWFVPVALAVLVIGVLVWWRWPEGPTPPPREGTVVGWRFSGDYPHRCKLWIKPLGAMIDDKVLANPNDDSECLTLRIGDRWTRR